MRRRWVFAAGAATAVVTAFALATGLRFLLPQIQAASADVSGFTQEQLEAHFAELNSAWAYATILPWLVTAALIGLVATLTLAALRARLGQRASDSAMASRDASTAASRS